MSRFRRRLMGLAALRQAAADDFVRVEYIENISTAYIDTLFKPNNKTKIEVSVELVNIQKLQWIYGARNNQQNSSLAILYGAKVGTANLNYGYLRYDFGDKQNSNNNFIENKKWKISNESNVLTYTDGTEENTYTITCANNSFTCNYNLYLFNLNNRNTISNSNAFLGKIYSFKIFNGNTLIRDYIPMYQISKDTYGLWDRVTKEFYTSPNGVKFTGGREIIYDAEIEYLQSTGTQYIQLDCNVTKTNKFSVGGVVIPIYTSDRVDYAVFSAKPWAQFIGAFYSKNNNNVITYSSIIGGLGAAGGVGGGWGGTVGTEVSFELSTTEKVVNGVHTSISRPLTNNITEFRIFGGYRDSTRYPIKIKSLYIKKENEILYDFIPVRIGNVGYLYDKVSNMLFGNNGSGSFILGQDTVVYD